MDYSVRESLVKSLAASVGFENADDTKTGNARYDSNTGTLYCNGMALPHSSIANIMNYYRKQMDHYKELAQRDRNIMESYMRAAVAYNAIYMMQENLEKS